MSVGRFYQFLLGRGRVTPDELRAIMARERENLPHPADYALRLGHVGPAQAKRIRVAQVKLNIPFLRAALDLGLMSRAQADEVREAQSADAAAMGQRLETLGLLSSEDVADAMRAFMDEQVHFAEKVMVLPADIPERGSILRMFEVAEEMFVNYWEMDVAPLDFDVRSHSLPLSDHNAEVRVRGDFPMRFYVGVRKECANAAALELLGESIESDEDRDDVVRELANVSCGHGLGALATQGKHAEMEPPVSVASPIRLGDDRAVTLALMTPFGAARLAVAFRSAG
jgi:CheY-specific phosphatase CheX